ncbi:MarR family winged helix-turn-helix transcriptional regulator [Pyxidicoccus caerfyrddinensis]|uniref:MarR family winged helix-turn-helix transcriptional regulator n=1 Tax=Pyxidicoccus caerfyrddinensis TaxID=2709663 RepID=UPI0013DCD6C3|nr:MarR family transcriptional regulator [Pyxidicoccus caerfyrddinensis]
MTGARDRLEAEVGVEIGALLAGARAVTNAAASAFIADHPELKPMSFHVARWLHSFGAAQPTEIASGLGLDKGALSRVLLGLKGARLITKRPSPHDGRAFTVVLTAAGTKLLARSLEGKGAELKHRLARFEDDELDTLAALLRRLNEP